jgi:NAD(P)-dependent dehydrogenase (short-subunit alcohol dehydrogenase family)
MRFQGKVGIVTGAAQGIGEACVRRLTEEGAQIVGADISERLDEAMATHGAAAIRTDVGDAQAVQDMVAKTVERFGKVDFLINNAGITAAADFLDYRLEDFERVLRVNLLSAFVASQAVARHLVSRGASGSIINMSSVNGKLALPNQTAYVTSKGGLNQLTTVMSVALAAKGIRVNGIAPGTIVTELTRARVLATEESRRRILSRTPIGRAGEVEEIASVAAFLISDDASYITGQTIYVDGGRLGLNYTVEVPAQG